MSFARIGVNAATRAVDLAVWQTLWDSWNMGSATCQYGNLDGCTRGDPCGTCTDTDGSTKNIQCTSTADGNAITVLRIYSCGLSGTLFDMQFLLWIFLIFSILLFYLVCDGPVLTFLLFSKGEYFW